MSEVFDSIKQGLKEAIAFAEGKNMGAKVFKPSEIDVKELRQNIGMTQADGMVRFTMHIHLTSSNLPVDSRKSAMV